MQHLQTGCHTQQFAGTEPLRCMPLTFSQPRRCCMALASAGSAEYAPQLILTPTHVHGNGFPTDHFVHIPAIPLDLLLLFQSPPSLSRIQTISRWAAIVCLTEANPTNITGCAHSRLPSTTSAYQHDKNAMAERFKISLNKTKHITYTPNPTILSRTHTAHQSSQTLLGSRCQPKLGFAAQNPNGCTKYNGRGGANAIAT